MRFHRKWESHRDCVHQAREDFYEALEIYYEKWHWMGS